MQEMKFYIMNNNYPMVNGETGKAIQFNSFEEANTLFAVLPEDMKKEGKVKNIILFYDDGYEEFGYDYNMVIENGLLAIYVDNEKYKIYDSDGNYFNYLGEVSEDFSKEMEKISNILYNEKSNFLPEFNLCLFFDELFPIKEIVHINKFKENELLYKKDNDPSYINRFGNYYIIQKEEWYKLNKNILPCR